MSAAPGPDRAPHQRVWLQAMVVFVAALALYLLLPQRGLHGVDGNSFVVWVEEGDTGSYARHAAYLHLCTAVFGALEPFGATGHDALLATSAFGSAIGLFFLVFAFARLAPSRPGPPALAAVAVLVTPSAFYFATVGEIAGVLAAGVGLAWLQAARWLDRPTVLRAASLGVATAVAGALHALGHLLTPALLAFAAILGRLPTNGRIPQVLTVLLAHGLTAGLLSWLLSSGASGQAADAAGVIREYWETFAPLTTPAVIWREWIVPALPWSVGALAALTARGSRRPGLAALAVIGLYVPANVVFLGYHEIHEAGAYFLPAVPAAVLATICFVNRRGLLLATIAGVAVTIATIAPGWQHPVPLDYGAGVRALNEEHKVALVVATRAELEGARIAVKGLMAMELGGIVHAYVQLPAPAPPFSPWFDQYHDGLARLGMTTVFSESTREFLATTTDPQLRPFWREHVPARYLVTEVERQGFRGVTLTRR